MGDSPAGGCLHAQGAEQAGSTHVAKQTDQDDLGAAASWQAAVDVPAGCWCGLQVGRGDCGEMHHSIRRAEFAEGMILATAPLHRVHHLREIGQIDLQHRADRIGGWLHVDVQHVVAALDKMSAHRPPGLAAASGDKDVFHGAISFMALTLCRV